MTLSNLLVCFAPSLSLTGGFLSFLTQNATAFWHLASPEQIVSPVAPPAIRFEGPAPTSTSADPSGPESQAERTSNPYNSQGERLLAAIANQRKHSLGSLLAGNGANLNGKSKDQQRTSVPSPTKNPIGLPSVDDQLSKAKARFSKTHRAVRAAMMRNNSQGSSTQDQ